MKNIYLSSLFCLLLSTPVFSQVEFGVKAGVQAAGVHDVNIPQYNVDPKARFSYHMGGFSHMPINQRVSLQLELLYANKGYYSRAEDITAYLHYVNLPVLLNYEVYENLYFGIGPEFGYLVSAKRKLGGHIGEADFFYDKSWDIGIDAGIEYKPVNFLKVGLRYNYGLSNILGDDVWATDEQGNVLDTQPKMQNRGLQLSVGYIFNRKK